MKRFELIKTLDQEEMKIFFYHNTEYTRKGLKKIGEWLDEEVTEEEIKKAKQ